ncbi:hypothetical protein BH09BAC2_BH09BAC2_14530 [soil metagenome]
MNDQKTIIIKQLAVVFLLISVLVFSFKNFLTDHGFNTTFVLIANIFLFIISVIAILIQYRGVTSANNQAFFRAVYSAMMIRMFLSAIAIVIYAVAVDGAVNKPALLTSMGLYLLYTAIEVKGLMKTLRKKNG